MNKLIKILKDTPFHKEGIKLSITDFRAVYGWICTNTTTNEELVKYLETEWKLNQQKEYQKQIGKWFQVIENFEEEPLVFIHEDLWYVKEFDGLYHAFISPMFYANYLDNKRHESCEVKKISISEARKLIQESKFKKTILYCTNNINKKM